MNKISIYLMIPVLFSMMFVTLLAEQAFGQKFDEPAGTSGLSMFGGNAPESTGQSANLPLDRLSEKDEKIAGRTPFQKQITINPTGLELNVVAMQIPTGKRLVIENVSVVVRCSESQRMEVDFSTYAGNGAGAAQMTIHKLVLQKQGSFRESAIFTASESGLIFADEKIGNEHFSVGVAARLNAVTAAFAQAQFTFTGYLEDLPTAQ
ncbi:MAG TPA: hypothetical protein VNB22_16040 [Pyrinomonadaceae bacterium]|nr:hypothetical protein [Pyrinomonadaceae bacterium]